MQYPPRAAIDAAVETLTDAGFKATYKPSREPDIEDDEIEIANPGKDWSIGMQIGPGYIGLNRYTETPFTMDMLGDHPNLITATDAAIEYLRKAA